MPSSYCCSTEGKDAQRYCIHSNSMQATLIALPCCMQTVYFIRHGEGYHNIGVVNEDAHLTDMGWRQAEALHQHLGNMRPPPDIQVCIFANALQSRCGSKSCIVSYSTKQRSPLCALMCAGLSQLYAGWSSGFLTLHA